MGSTKKLPQEARAKRGSAFSMQVASDLVRKMGGAGDVVICGNKNGH